MGPRIEGRGWRFPAVQLRTDDIRAIPGDQRARTALLEGQCPFQLQNGIDKRKQVMQTLKFLHGDFADVSCLDITTIPEDSLKPTHGFIGTSPCEDFSMLYSGTDGGINGSRGDLFMVQLRMIERMAHKNTGSTKLQWVLLETCRGFLANTRKGCAWAVVEAWWLANMYDFTRSKCGTCSSWGARAPTLGAE